MDKLYPIQAVNFVEEVVMLRNRSRAVTSKQGLMTDHSSKSFPNNQNLTKPIPSFFGSPRFPFEGLPKSDPVMSPTSILDATKPFPTFKSNPFWNESSQPNTSKVLSENKHSWNKLDSKGIGVALDLSIEENSNSVSKPKLKVQIPPLVPNLMVSAVQSPKSPGDFGIKTRRSQVMATGSGNSGMEMVNSPRVFTGCLTLSEMELSEDYTCVISHGPNPKTTHIFDNCIVENYCSLSNKSSPMPKSFLSFCYTCKKNLEQKNDIYIYGGEKAFCSRECRYQEMLLDEAKN